MVEFLVDYRDDEIFLQPRSNVARAYFRQILTLDDEVSHLEYDIRRKKRSELLLMRNYKNVGKTRS